MTHIQRILNPGHRFWLEVGDQVTDILRCNGIVHDNRHGVSLFLKDIREAVITAFNEGAYCDDILRRRYAHLFQGQKDVYDFEHWERDPKKKRNHRIRLNKDGFRLACTRVEDLGTYARCFVEKETGIKELNGKPEKLIVIDRTKTFPDGSLETSRMGIGVVEDSLELYVNRVFHPAAINESNGAPGYWSF